eukprot:603596_1
MALSTYSTRSNKSISELPTRVALPPIPKQASLPTLVASIKPLKPATISIGRTRNLSDMHNESDVVDSLDAQPPRKRQRVDPQDSTGSPSPSTITSAITHVSSAMENSTSPPAACLAAQQINTNNASSYAPQQQTNVRHAQAQCRYSTACARTSVTPDHMNTRLASNKTFLRTLPSATNRRNRVVSHSPNVFADGHVAPMYVGYKTIQHPRTQTKIITNAFSDDADQTVYNKPVMAYQTHPQHAQQPQRDRTYIYRNQQYQMQQRVQTSYCNMQNM